MGPPAPKSTNQLAQERTDLAVHRTLLAATRSLMAWVRTGLSLIGFGFTIYKFIEGFGAEVRPQTARNVGLFLIAWGTASILFGLVEYRETVRVIGETYRVSPRLFPVVMAGVVVALGAVLFLSVVFRLT